MKPNLKSTIKTYTVFLAGFALVMLASIVTIAIIGLKNAGSNISDMNRIREKTDYLYSVRISFEKTITLSRDLVIYAEDSEITSQTINKMPADIDEMNFCFGIYISEITNVQEMELAQSVGHLIPEYDDYLVQMMELGAAGNAEAMKALSSENAPIVMKISDNLQMMYDLGQDESMMYADHYEYSGNTFIVMLICVSVVAFIIIIAASIALLFAIRKLPSSLSETQETAWDSQNYTQADGYTQAELEKCVTDLKAVAFDLSQSVKELKR